MSTWNGFLLDDCCWEAVYKIEVPFSTSVQSVFVRCFLRLQQRSAPLFTIKWWNHWYWLHLSSANQPLEFIVHTCEKWYAQVIGGTFQCKVLKKFRIGISSIKSTVLTPLHTNNGFAAMLTMKKILHRFAWEKVNQIRKVCIVCWIYWVNMNFL